jgi:hypothetical protein
LYRRPKLGVKSKKKGKPCVNIEPVIIDIVRERVDKRNSAPTAITAVLAGAAPKTQDFLLKFHITHTRACFSNKNKKEEGVACLFVLKTQYGRL